MDRGNCVSSNNHHSNETEKSKQQSWLGNIWNWWVSCCLRSLSLSHYLRTGNNKDPLNSSSRSVLTEDVLKIRRKRTEEAEDALAGGLNKANIFMSF